MRTITAVLVASSLLVSNAFGAAKTAPLPAGKPAGVKEAAMLGPDFALILAGLGIVIGGVVLAATKVGGDGVTTPTTSSTGTGLP